jgi:hypothetical protein
VARRVTHRITVAKRNLFGSRRWWATCTCHTFYQGCYEKQEAQRLAAEHLRLALTREGDNDG